MGPLVGELHALLGRYINDSAARGDAAFRSRAPLGEATIRNRNYFRVRAEFHF